MRYNKYELLKRENLKYVCVLQFHNTGAPTVSCLSRLYTYLCFLWMSPQDFLHSLIMLSSSSFHVACVPSKHFPPIFIIQVVLGITSADIAAV